MQQRYDEIQRIGGDVLVITQAPLTLLATFVRKESLPFQVVADMDCAAYRDFGLERTSWNTMFRFDVVLRFLRLILRGWLPRRPHKSEDVLQLGGDFVLDTACRLFYAYRSADPTDRPTLEELVDVLRRAAAASRRNP